MHEHMLTSHTLSPFFGDTNILTFVGLLNLAASLALLLRRRLGLCYVEEQVRRLGVSRQRAKVLTIQVVGAAVEDAESPVTSVCINGHGGAQCANQGSPGDKRTVQLALMCLS